MDIKLLFLMLFIFTINKEIFSQELDSNCLFIYECCNRTDDDCLEYCEPIIECTTPEEEETTSEPEEITEEPQFEIPVTHKVLTITTCRNGFRYQDGACRRVFG